MSCENQTNKALQPAWRGTHELADGIPQPRRCNAIVIGIGETGNKTVTWLEKKGTDAHTMVINTSTLKPKTSQAEAFADAEVVFVASGLTSRKESKTALAIARTAKEKGLLAIGVVIKPPKPEKTRTKQATTHTLDELRNECDTLVLVDSDNLSELTPQLTPDEAFGITTQILANVIKELIESISTPSIVNPDSADFKSIVKQGGVARIGIGESNAPNRAEEAVRNALRSPMLETDCTSATGALVHVTGDSRMTLDEVNRVKDIVADMTHNNAQMILGAGVNPELEGKLRVTLVMTGISPPKFKGYSEAIAPQLFNLEPYSRPEKKISVDLGLYQLENF